MRSTEGGTVVAVLAVPGAYALDLGVAVHVFSRYPGYRVVVCAEDAGAAAAGESAAGELRPTRGPEAVAGADVVVVPGYEDPLSPLPEGCAAALRAAVGRGARVIAICTGVFALAAEGLLDGRAATTHWRHTAALRERHPRVDVVENRLFVVDGPLVTTAGAGAGIDACLHVVRAEFGAVAADGVAKEVVVSPARDAREPQFAELPAASRESLRATREWVLGRLGSPVTVQEMADHALLSRRTFIRRFTRETGMPPMRWVTSQRILLARRLLESSDRPVERIAAASGFGTAGHFRAVFRREVGVTPSAYRAAHPLPERPGPASQRAATSSATS
ncbi:GlxA family transcriptional regulator [Streptomyces sp. AA0539]|uniref:GlxA family transcriptional regulator n=1 Tax=Streptomyces sp. AA0539 TaxID=1210045 RepID=UPI0002E11CDF|nr:helix-turn-helix domain-containing protein [Streptomyces sp. AA0539]